MQNNNQVPLEPSTTAQTSQSEPQKPETVKVPKVETVELPKEQYEKLMGLIPAVEKLQKDNEALTFAADRARLDIFNERQQQPGNKTVRLRTFLDEDGKRKVVVAWAKAKDEIYKAPNGAQVEDQSMEIVLEDNTKKTLTYRAFTIETADKIKAEVLEETPSSLKVRTVDGKEYLIGKTPNETFVN